MLQRNAGLRITNFLEGVPQGNFEDEFLGDLEDKPLVYLGDGFEGILALLGYKPLCMLVCVYICISCPSTIRILTN